jgi:hypothetical protein
MLSDRLASASCNLLAAVADYLPGTPRGLRLSQGARPVNSAASSAARTTLSPFAQ